MQQSNTTVTFSPYIALLTLRDGKYKVQLDQFTLPKEVLVSLYSKDQWTMGEELTFHRI